MCSIIETPDLGTLRAVVSINDAWPAEHPAYVQAPPAACGGQPERGYPSVR